MGVYVYNVYTAVRAVKIVLCCISNKIFTLTEYSLI